MRRQFLGALALSVLLSPLACSDGTEPAPVPTTIQLSPSEVSVPDGESTRIDVTVRDQNGNPLTPLPAGTTITWSSSDDAIASVAGGFVTGNRPGTAQVRAQAGTASGTATVRVLQVPTMLRREAGDAQQGQAGEPLRDSLEVRVLDRHGSGVPNVAVTWEIVNGGGTVAAGSATSNASGIARAAWRLGGEVGPQSVRVSAANLSLPVLFNATATSIRAEDAPVITAVSPSTLVPGGTATIIGANFGNSASALDVRVGGAPVQVTAASPNQLTVRLPQRGALPCQPTGPISVTVAFGGFTARRDHPMQVGATRTVAVGQMLVLTGADDLACNELAPGRYMVTTFNASRNLAGTVAVDFRGSVATAAAAAPLAERAFTPPAVEPRPLSAQDAEHMRLLETNRELLRRLAPARRAQPALSRSVSAAASPAVGDTLSFRVPRLSASNLCTGFDSIRARVVYAGPRVVVFEDTRAPLAGQTDNVYIAAAREYERDQHQILLDNFGNPFALGSELTNTDKIYMLFNRTVNDASNAAGFVFSGDFFPRSLCSASNRAAIFYARVPTVNGTSLNQDTPDRWLWTMRSTIIHEVKHIISFAERLKRDATDWEESWLEESTARISEELWARRVYGYEAKQSVTYQQSLYCEGSPLRAEHCAGTPFVMRKHFTGLYDYLAGVGNLSPLGGISGSDASFYGSGWSLVRWSIDHTGGSESAFLRALTQETTRTGVANIEARTGRQWADILPAWSLGLAVSGLTGVQVQRQDVSFPSWNLASIFAGMNADFPGSFGRAVPNYQSMGAGAFARQGAPLRGGAGAVYELGQSSQARTLQLRGQGGADPFPSVGMAILRLN